MFAVQYLNEVGEEGAQEGTSRIVISLGAGHDVLQDRIPARHVMIGQTARW